MKALGTAWAQGVRFTDIAVITADDGAPRLELTGEARARADRLRATGVHVSLSHSDGMAVAVVVIEG